MRLERENWGWKIAKMLLGPIISAVGVLLLFIGAALLILVIRSAIFGGESSGSIVQSGLCSGGGLIAVIVGRYLERESDRRVR